jgi:ubiquinone/menaquinone biosynthesis C-methylase UbiE
MAKDDIGVGFRAVDQAANPTAFLQYLDAANLVASIQAMKRQTFALLEVKEGAQLLDVGCGLGDDARTLAQMVGAGGRVVGVDQSEAMVAEAKRRAAGVQLPVTYAEGDAHRLDFADNTFDGCRAERLLVHLANPRQALAERVRVVRPRGRVVALDPEPETLVIDAEDREMTRKVVTYFSHSGRNVWVGRQLRRLFHEANLTEIAVFADTVMLTTYAEANQVLQLEDKVTRLQAAGTASEAEVTAWLKALRQADQAGHFFAGFTCFFAHGRKR